MLGLLHKFSLHAHDPSVGYLAIKTNEYERVMKARVSTINKFIIPGWVGGGVRPYSSAASSVSHQTIIPPTKKRLLPTHTHRWRRMGSPPPIHRSAQTPSPLSNSTGGLGESVRRLGGSGAAGSRRTTAGGHRTARCGRLRRLWPRPRRWRWR